MISITRISNITLEAGCEFTVSGDYQNSDYTVILQEYKADAEMLICETLGLTKDEYSQTIKPQLEIFTWVDHHNYQIELVPNAYYLIVVVKRPSFGDGGELCTIRETVLTALRLHFSRGLRYHNTYEFRIYPPPHNEKIQVALQAPLTSQMEFSPLFIENISLLPPHEFDACILTFKFLLERSQNSNCAYEKVLQLALIYHATSFTFGKVEHSFLIMMVIFEALFKKKNEKNTSNAVNRISKLLGIDSSEIKKIRKEFTQNPNFCRLRNDIAHGDITANQSLINSNYYGLYSYITRAIIELISFGGNGYIDLSKDYYDEINQFIENRYQLILVNSKTAKQ